MKLHEILNAVAPFRHTASDEEFRARATIGRRDILFTAHYSRYSRMWEIEFSEAARGTTSHEITGSGAEFQVFATVVEMARRFIAECQPAAISFTASKADGARSSLYKRLVSRLTRGGSWKVMHDRTTSDYREYFMLTRELTEAPLADLSFHGSEEPASFTAAELRLMRRYHVERVYHERLKGLPFALYVYIVNHAAVAELGREFPESRVSLDDGQPAFVDATTSSLGRRILAALQHPDIKTVFSAIATNHARDPEAVHFIMGDNYAGDGTINVTPWIIVHRLVHTFPELDESVSTAFTRGVMSATKRPEAAARQRAAFPDLEPRGETRDALAFIDLGEVFDVRSLRTGRTTAGSEALAELATKYLTTGALRLNTRYVHDSWDEADAAEIERALRHFKVSLERHVDEQVQDLRGQVVYI